MRQQPIDICRSTSACGATRSPSRARSSALRVAALMLLGLAPAHAQLITDLRDTTIACDYLVVSPPEFLASSLRLAQHRRDWQSDAVERPLVVCFDSVTSQFPSSGPRRGCESLWQALKFASERWLQSPRFLVLVGSDSVAYRFEDTSSLSYGSMPTFVDYTSTAFTSEGKVDTILAYTDRYFAATRCAAPPKTRSFYPCSTSNLAIGRIPCETAFECSVYVDKVIRFEATTHGGPLSNTVLLMADDAFQRDQPDAIRHDRCAEDLANQRLRGWFVDKLYLGMYAKDSTGSHSMAKQAFLDYARRGMRWCVYFGHGHRDSLSDEGFLRSSDAPQLVADTLPFVFFSFSCDNGDFAHKTSPAMCSRYLFTPTGGCIAYFASSYLEYAETNSLLAGIMFGLAKEQPGFALGESTREGLANAIVQGVHYNLLGDPALVFTRPHLDVTLSATSQADGSVLCAVSAAPAQGVQYVLRITRPDTVRVLDDTTQRWVRDSVLLTSSGQGPLPLEFTVSSEIAAAPFRLSAYAWSDGAEGRADSLFQPVTLARAGAGKPAPGPAVRVSVLGRRLVVDAAGRAQLRMRILSIDGRQIVNRIVHESGPVSFDLGTVLAAAGSYVLTVSAGNQTLVRTIAWPGR
jgi:hypothetical protein